MRGATGVTIQPHQILRLSRRKTHILSPHHIWNVIYSARSNRCHHPTSPNTAPATKNDSTALSSSHMKRHFQCAEQQVSLSNLTKYCACHEKWHCKISKKISKNRWNVISNAGPIRAWSDHDPTMKTQTATRLASEVTFRAHHEHFLLKNTTFRAQSYIQTFTKYCACHVKCHLNFTKYCACHAERLTYLVLIAYETSFTVRGATGVTIQPHQILRLPRKMTRLLYRPHIWNVISNARSNRCHHPTSPNTAPATKNDSTALSSSHMKRHFQCAEQQVSLSNLTKYCACHEKWHCKISKKISKNRWNVISNAGPIRAWSDHDPTMKTQTATRLASEVTFRAHHEHFLLKNTTFRAQSYIQTFTKYCACHVKCHLNFTKYCACHAERLTYLVLIAYETSFTVRGATGVTIQPHQILRLPRKMTRLLYRPHIHYSTWHYSTWHYSTWLYSTWLYSTWLYLTLLYVTLLYVTLLYLTLLYLTLLYLTLLDTTLRDTTLLGSYSTWLYSTWPAPLDLTLLRCCSYIGSFST